ncbi:MAG TPA: DHA2 family efflux MFS transporter permease subunit [Candidatus Saccharimonadales bacterium]|nr:DHA2 family efflux MFS transporter permease subunit [Candidatus Saccharimonadales bacterium]
MTDRAQQPAGAINGAEGLHLSTGRGRWVLSATVLGSSMAMLDGSVVGIAQPAIGKDFHAAISGLQWVSVGYLLSLAGLLLLSGALADRFGRRRLFIVGVAWFAMASLICATAPNIELLIAARGLQGVGGALLTPGSLAILEASFAPGERGRVIGAWSGLGGAATALGPFMGGFLITAVSWRLIFLINAPIAVVVIWISLRHVPESRDPQATGYIDIAGSALTIVALVGISYGLIQGTAGSWTSPVVLGALGIGVVALMAFVVVELRVHAPIVPLEIFRSRQFSATNVETLLIYGMLGGVFFLLPIELQQVSHYSPTLAGASLLPATGLMFLLSARSGALSARIGPRLQMSVGPLLMAAGMALYARIDASGNYLLEVLPAVLVFGFGLSILVAPLTATALSSAPAERTGLASAVNNAVARTGSLLAVAILPALAGITGDSYLHPAVFESGFQRAALIAAVVCAAAGVFAAATIRNPRTPRSANPMLDGQYHCDVDAPPLRRDSEGDRVAVSVSARRPG